MIKLSLAGNVSFLVQLYQPDATIYPRWQCCSVVFTHFIQLFKNASQKLPQLQFSECSKAMSWWNLSSHTEKQRQRVKTAFALDVESPWPYMFLIHDTYLFVCHRGKDRDRNGPLKAKPWGWELWRAGIRHAQSVPPFQISFTGLSTWTGFS